jgi:hypothetical protein
MDTSFPRHCKISQSQTFKTFSKGITNILPREIYTAAILEKNIKRDQEKKRKGEI